MSFKAFGKIFDIVLPIEEKQYYPGDAVVEVFDEDGSKNYSIWKLRLKNFHGHLKNHPLSSLYGSCSGDEINGVIHHENVDYFFESSKKYFNVGSPLEIVVYRSSDYKFFPTSASTYESKSNKRSKMDHLIYLDMDNSDEIEDQKTSKRESDTYKSSRCQIEIVADDTFYNTYEKNVDKATAAMTFFVRYASEIFQKTDFDSDGQPDNFQIEVKKIAIFKSKKYDDYKWDVGKVDGMSSMLRGFAKRLAKDKFCLSVLFVDQIFNSGEVGLAYTGNPSKAKAGGLCDVKRNIGGQLLQVNTAMVTIRSKDGNIMPDISIGITTAHEIGHSGGSGHDDAEKKECTPGRETGNFIMFPYLTDGQKDNHKLFSPCSRKQMHDFMSSEKGNCFIAGNVPEGPKGKNETAEETSGEEKLKQSSSWLMFLSVLVVHLYIRFILCI